MAGLEPARLGWTRSDKALPEKIWRISARHYLTRPNGARPDNARSINNHLKGFNMEDETRKTIPEMSIDTRVCVNRLKEAKSGEVIPYKELSELIGRDVQNSAYSVLFSARRIVERDYRIVFHPIRSIGLKRLDDTGIVSVGESTLSKIRKVTKRGIKQIACVQDFNNLSQEQKIKHNTYLSMLGVMHHASQGKSVQKLENKVREAQASLPLAKTLEAFI